MTVSAMRVQVNRLEESSAIIVHVIYSHIVQEPIESLMNQFTSQPSIKFKYYNSSEKYDDLVNQISEKYIKFKLELSYRWMSLCVCLPGMLGMHWDDNNEAFLFVLDRWPQIMSMSGLHAKDSCDIHCIMAVNRKSFVEIDTANMKTFAYGSNERN